MDPEDNHNEDASTTEEETTEQEESTEETEETTEDSTEQEESEGGDDSESGETDWKKIAEDERNRRKNAEKALGRERFKERKSRRNADESEDDDDYSDDDDDDDTPMTRKEFERAMAKERQEARREALAEHAKSIASKITESEDEADAVLAVYENRTFPEGMSIEDQLQEAYYIAHGPRLKAKIGEQRRTIKSKNTRSRKGNENAHRDAPAGNAPAISAGKKGELERRGFTFDGKEYSKILPNGKKMVFDAKANKPVIRK